MSDERHQATRPSASRLRMRIGGRGKAAVDAAGARAMLHRISNFSHLGQVSQTFLGGLWPSGSPGSTRGRRGGAPSAYSAHRARDLVRLQALAATTSGFAHLLALLDRRLHVMTAALQLTQNALRSHLALEVLDRTLNAFVANLDLERPALNRFAGISQGAVGMTEPAGLGKPRSTRSRSLLLEFWRAACRICRI